MCLKSDIRKIETVQRTFTRLLCKKLNIQYNDYLDRLKILNLDSLEQRRLKTDLILAYKIRHKLVNLNAIPFLTLNDIPQLYNLRRHTENLSSSFSKSSIRAQFFSNRIIKVWNKLPQELVSSNSLQIFKTKIKLMDLSRYTDLIF